jgi:integrase
MLSDTAIRKTKPKSVPSKLADEKGLYLLFHPNGSRYWRMDYRHAGKRKTLSFGVYPETSLKQARQKRDEARTLLAEGVDPAENRKAQKASITKSASNSFEVICREWLEGRKATVELAQHHKTLSRMVNDVFPWLGPRPIAEISAPEVLTVLQRIDSRGARYTAHRVRSEISCCFRYAIATGRAIYDPCPNLKGAIPPAKEKNFASITDPVGAGELLRAIDGFNGTFPVLCALKLAPLFFCRPGELRTAKWADFDLEKAEWRYYINKTKSHHLVPLAKQAMTILKDLQPLTGSGQYLFPGVRDPNRSMSDGTINAALRRLGYTKDEFTGHGFRAMARTIIAEELHLQPEVIEHQLAHAVPDTLGKAYNRTKYLKDRKNMMQLWADYLDQIKQGAKIVSIRQNH